MTEAHTITFPARIVARDEPHSDYGGWKNFLRNHCEVRDEVDGVLSFGATNCNYILFPCGYLVENFGFHGKALMNEIRDDGKEAVLDKVKAIHDEVQYALACMREGRLYRSKEKRSKEKRDGQ